MRFQRAAKLAVSPLLLLHTLLMPQAAAAKPPKVVVVLGNTKLALTQMRVTVANLGVAT